MAKALVSGFLKSKKAVREQVFAYAPHQDKLRENASAIGFNAVSSLSSLVESSDILIIACKPYQVASVLQELNQQVENKALVSIAAGWNHERFTLSHRRCRFQYVMPNTPAMVGAGVMLFEECHSLTEEEHQEVLELFGSVGLVRIMPSHLMGIGMAITGCGPAFVDVMMEAYADAAVKYGISRQDAYQLVAQMILGSAKLCLETGQHPGVLKDAVCSPGGTTIKGVTELEAKGFRHACIASIDAIMQS